MQKTYCYGHNIAKSLRDLEEIDLDEDDPFAGLIAAVGFAIRSTYHTTLQSTPGQLVFGRDMIFNILHIADWEYIKQRKQQMIHKNNQRENSNHIEHTYKVGDKGLVRRGTENKFEMQ